MGTAPSPRIKLLQLHIKHLRESADIQTGAHTVRQKPVPHRRGKLNSSSSVRVLGATAMSKRFGMIPAGCEEPGWVQ